MTEVYEVLLQDRGQRWHVGWVLEEDADLLLHDGDAVLAFPSRPALEHHCQEAGLELLDELPDEIDLDLGGWLAGTGPAPSTQEVSELWHLLLDDPAAGVPLHGEEVEEAYDDLVEADPEFFATHGELARRALSDAVRRLRTVLRPPTPGP
jgi:hypothetical protein